MAPDGGAAPGARWVGERPVVDGWLRVCNGDALRERGEAVTFELPPVASGRMVVRAFVVRVDGRARAYVNRCAHVPVALDWVPGEVFDPERRHLLCSVHGAEYDPASGACIAGPCRGRGGLAGLAAVERGGWVWIGIGTPPGQPPADPPGHLDFRDDD